MFRAAIFFTVEQLQEGTLFTFVEMQQEYGGEWPSTNNAVESVNARLRDMLRHHRGLPLLHRIKAIFWWCYMHTENPLSAAETLRVMPTDDDVDGLFTAASSGSKREDGALEEVTVTLNYDIEESEPARLKISRVRTDSSWWSIGGSNP